jgi:peptidoglycan-N-acetylglucosamine deacetylase
VIRYVLAPHVPSFARSLGIPRTLPELAAAQLVASGPPAVGERDHLADKPRTVAVTFDDGPHPDGTPRMLDILARHEANATFFLAGEQVVKRPELARRILEEGHAIGIYSPASLRIARERGLQPLMWSRWGKDWRKFTTAARITARAVGDIQDGDVILLHDADFYSSVRSHQRTAAALPAILTTLKSAELGTVACA